MARLVIFGTQGSAREIAWLASDTTFHDQRLAPAAFVDAENAPRIGGSQNGLPIMTAKQARAQFPDALAIIAVGSPNLRRLLAEEARIAGFAFASVIHPAALVSPTAQFGEGVVLYPQVVVATNVRIGAHVQINVGTTVSHDTLVEDFVTLSPQVCICGHVHIKEDVFVGAGATVINGSSEKKLTLGSGANVAAGACVVGDVASGVLVKGVPAKSGGGALA